MRRAALLLLVACAAALVPAAPAAAYRLQTYRWYSSTLTYFDATGKYGTEIRAAARAWNTSGARVRLRPAPRRSARVIIRIDRRLPSAGRATYPVSGGIVSRATVDLRADLAKGFSSPAAVRAGITAVIAHELGHVLGLNHENRRCATMNSNLWSRCARAPEPWRYRCRALEADDVRGLVRRFGGRVRTVGPEFCAAEPAPGAPAALTATTVDGINGTVRLTWTLRGAARTRILRRDGTCPTGPEDPEAEWIGEVAATVTAFDDFVPPGRYCYAVVGTGPLGRPGPLATITHEVLGAPPVARFGWFDEGDLAAVFEDSSYDADGVVVAWRWDFGDGSGSTENSPRHVYAAPGTYTVTLTVTDSSGQSATATQAVTVASH